MLGKPPVERFWDYVSKAPNSCWPWTGTRDEKGYGRHYVGRDQLKAHRYSYELLVGPIPAGLVIDHLCRNTSCVNPDHLEPVTNRENNRRGAVLITACPQGHPYDERNTVLDGKGHRTCRECRRVRTALWRARRRGVTT
jgi:hypothetical protein